MSNNSFMKKASKIFILFFILCNHSFAQEGRLPTNEEVAIKAKLEQVYKNGATPININKHLMTTGPEQDCANAISVCQQSYTQSNSYTGYGTQELSSTCLSSDETNSVWYTFTVQTPGTFNFLLTTSKDYDFALFDISNLGCAGVPTSTPVRCNYSATSGNTGLTSSIATGNLSVTSLGSPTMPGLNVTAGQTFALIIDNYTANSNGYTLTFGGTATIFDNTPPAFLTLVHPCNTSYVDLTFTESVGCNTIQTNGSNFLITGPGAINVPVTSASGLNCAGGAAATNKATINFNATGLPTGIYTLSTTGTPPIVDNCGNPMLNQSLTFQYIAPITTSVSKPFICFGDSSIVHVIPSLSVAGLTYSWAPESGTYDSLVAHPTTITTYTVTQTYGGCSLTANATVTVSPLVSITGNQPFCPGDSITLTAVPTISSGVSYLWSTAASSPVIQVYSAGTYNVTLNYGNGCTTNTSTTVTQFNSPVAYFTTSPNTANSYNFADQSTIALPDSIINWHWNFGENSSSYSLLQNPTYQYASDAVHNVILAVQTNNGCWDSISINLISDIQIPNVVTPNDGGNSGLNKLFYIKNLNYFPGTALTVFNRWGKKVYENKNYNEKNDWDCEKNPAGVYYYVLEGPKLKETKYGFFQILR